jgi:Zn-dependent protease with chaperone function
MEKDRLNKLEKIKRKLKEAKKKLKLADLERKLERAKRRLGKPKKSPKTKPQEFFWYNIVENLLKTLGKKTPHDGIPKDGLILSADDFRMPGERLVLYGSLMCLALLVFIIPPVLFIFPILIAITVIMVKTKQGQLLGQSVKVSPNQFPEVYQAARIAAHRLEMKMPKVFISFNPFINAYALGFFGEKSVMLYSKTVEVMSKDELISIIGHEFSHIKCNHTNWTVITASAEELRIPIVSSIMGFILLMWSRKAEFTADRGGLLTSRDLKASISALAKLTVGPKLFEELNIDKMIDQMDEVDIIAKLGEMLGTHPYIIKRIHALKVFYNSETYAKFSQI